MSRLIIATRGSALALWQARHTEAALRARSPDLELELSIIKTTGDAIQDVPLSQVGGKALFVKEIEQALLAGEADLAVHSMKDVPAELAPGLQLAAISTGETPFDALCTRDGRGLDDLAQGATVGTSSMRRQAQLLARRPDLRIQMLRGNVPTRLQKLDDGGFDAIVLAAAGLTRLGFVARISQVLPPEICLPAVAQGVLALETRIDEHRESGGVGTLGASLLGRGRSPRGMTAPETTALVRAAMHDPREARRITAERAFLARMGGSCQTPLAAHATFDGDTLSIDALCASTDGARVLRERVTGIADDAALGVAAADALLARGAGEILAATAMMTPHK